ncbi:hypothetical protein Zmor_016601 [Zophobas morio]|uniref:C2H2-type domain-containing protein n=1 Tax=Zophobas morio TaxID=2755281 RepID=A0AA38I7P6_9CUCU|nr:hypothetical protein Zmor_016601 [Zophobas morio]
MPFLVYSKAHTKSSSKKIHKCGRCPYFTTWYFLMVNHLKRHKWPRIFTCDKATVESYYCKDCNYQTTVTLLFILHVRKHDSIKKQRHEDPPQYSVRKYICGNCPFESHFSMTWYQHTFSCHKTKQIQEVAKQGTVWYYCEKCSFKTKLLTNLKGHCKVMHAPPELKDNFLLKNQMSSRLKKILSHSKSVNKFNC